MTLSKNREKSKQRTAKLASKACDMAKAQVRQMTQSTDVDEEALAQLREGGVDELLARHIAHLFVRDPLVIFQGRSTP